MNNRTPLILAIVLLLLPVLYVGSYSGIVVPEGVFGPFYLGLGSQPTRIITVRTDKHYRFASKHAAKFFWPLEQIDRKVRPRAWDSGYDQRHPPRSGPTELFDPFGEGQKSAP